MSTHSDVKEMSGSFVEQALILCSESKRLENVSRSAVTLEHRMIDDAAQVCHL